jgi:hypothetical protein
VRGILWGEEKTGIEVKRLGFCCMLTLSFLVFLAGEGSEAPTDVEADCWVISFVTHHRFVSIYTTLPLYRVWCFCPSRVRFSFCFAATLFDMCCMSAGDESSHKTYCLKPALPSPLSLSWFGMCMCVWS